MFVCSSHELITHPFVFVRSSQECGKGLCAFSRSLGRGMVFGRTTVAIQPLLEQADGSRSVGNGLMLGVMIAA